MGKGDYCTEVIGLKSFVCTVSLFFSQTFFFLNFCNDNNIVTVVSWGVRRRRRAEFLLETKLEGREQGRVGV